MKILIVDDDENSRIFLERSLLKQGHIVETAENGAVALKKALLAQPDLIISDILMPEMDGYEFCRRIKEDEHLRFIPFVFYTATYIEKKDQDFAMSLGASSFLIKPMDIDVFLNTINKIIEEHKEHRLPLYDKPLKNISELDRMQIEVLARKLDKKIRELEEEKIKLKKSEESLRLSQDELYNSYFTQSAINEILRESLKDIPLELVLQKALNIMLAVPNFTFENTGSIYIVEDVPEELVLRAKCNLSKSIERKCSKISFGICHCGKAALTQEIQVSEHNDENPELCCFGNGKHIHYAIPIVYSKETLGVINIFVKNNINMKEKTEEFLRLVADTLSGIIIREKTKQEKEKLHIQLLHSQKMEAIGKLAGGIAHDFNNILTAMIGYGHLLHVKMKQDDPLRIYAEHILSLSDRAANLIKNLLAFSRKKVMNPLPVNINEIIRGIELFLSRIIGEDIKLQIMLSEQDLIIMADEGQIEQVLMNLATNARDAMPDGGLLTIKTKTINIDNEFIKKHGYGKSGEFALIEISDTGIGMDRNTQEKIFEPFFTTKEIDKGTGLGLSIVYGIIKQHEGYINVYSEIGKGTTFRIYLPLLKQKIEEIKTESIQPQIEKGYETILLAEDNILISEFIKKLLEEYGYKVITSVDGQDAINKFKTHKDEIHLAILDVIMPYKNGKEAYDEMKTIKPDIKVLFISGYSSDIIKKFEILEKDFAYIEKPILPTKLLIKVREILKK